MTIQNAVKIIEVDPPIYLNSLHRHDYLGYTFKDGSAIFIDGGNSFHGGGAYIRSNGPYNRDGQCENYCLTDESSFEEIKNKLLWGTRGKKGDEKLRFVPLVECETGHLRAILETQTNIGNLHKQVVESILKDRPDNKVD